MEKLLQEQTTGDKLVLGQCRGTPCIGIFSRGKNIYIHNELKPTEGLAVEA